MDREQREVATSGAAKPAPTPAVRAPWRAPLVYKRMMLNDLPNVARSVEKTNASWTLKSDRIAVPRDLKNMTTRYPQLTIPLSWRRLCAAWRR
jgi:cation diffusion facilitator CzcD-associated flavoprotein CzcO